MRRRGTNLWLLSSLLRGKRKLPAGGPYVAEDKEAERNLKKEGDEKESGSIGEVDSI